MRPRSGKFLNGAGSTGRSFRKLTWTKPSWTVASGHRELHVHPSGSRRVSILEAMLLQGFPKKYRLLGSLSSQVSQVSNAVPPPVAAAIGKELYDLLYAQPRRIQEKLLNWYKTHRRKFPWRQNRSPYYVLVAEKLLQQTAASQGVVDTFSAFVSRYPTIDCLASAQVRDVRKMIAPLGLPARADELIRLGRLLQERHSSTVPAQFAALLRLPGVGDYIARAVLCFGFGRKEPIVDTNIARFLIRFYGIEGFTPKNPARSRTLRSLADRLLPENKPANFNFALLDFCAKVCKSSKPDCKLCPLHKDCRYADKDISRKARSTPRA